MTLHIVRIFGVSTFLTPSLPQPVKFPAWKVHIYTPPNSMFDGPVTNSIFDGPVTNSIFDVL